MIFFFGTIILYQGATLLGEWRVLRHTAHQLKNIMRFFCVLDAIFHY